MKTTAHQRIRAAMRANERAVLARINRELIWCPYPSLLGRPWRNALERLIAKGKVRRKRRSVNTMGLIGYIALSKHA